MFYIGKGTGRSLNDGGRNKKWKIFVESLYAQGLTYEQKILHICDAESQALELEAVEINRALSGGCLLLNNQIPDGHIEKLVQLDIEARRGDSLISDFVKRKRKELKLTQIELSKKAGVGLRFIRELEQNHKSHLRMDKVNQVLWLFGTYLVPYVVNKNNSHQ